MKPPNSVDIPIDEITNGIVMKVRLTGMTGFKIRAAIVMVLLRVVSWVAPFRVEIES